MPIKGWDHLELYVGNAKQAAYYYEYALGFRQTAYAGPETGTIVVTVEVPNLAALAKLEDTIRTNPDISAEMKKISAMRKIVSDSLYELLSH